MITNFRSEKRFFTNEFIQVSDRNKMKPYVLKTTDIISYKIIFNKHA